MTGLLARRAESCQGRWRLQRLVNLADTPVRWLECMSRMPKFPSADHEGGSGPACQQAAVTTRLLARRGESSSEMSTKQETCGLRGRTCQIVGIEGKPGQASQRRP